MLESPPAAASVPSPLVGEGQGGGDSQRSWNPPTPIPSAPRVEDAPPAREGGEERLWRDGAFHRDAWVRVADGDVLPDAPAIIPKKRWLAERDALSTRGAPLGILISAGESIDDVTADLPRFALIALDFPKFSDGRAFSTARLLREKHGYGAELRAVGNVLADQIPYMRRVGFDAFEVTHAPTRRALAEGRLAEVTLYYQPAGAIEAPAGTRPWLRRSPASEDNT
jgi:uncharacterized protein (DUF934 family)